MVFTEDLATVRFIGVSVIAPVGGGVLRISSDRDDRRILGDLKFVILVFFWAGKFWQVLKILTLFQTENAILTQTHFQAWFLRKNVIIA